MCCGYGKSGKGTMGYDCVIIPGAAKMTSPYTNLANQAFCGQRLVTANSATSSKTICCKFLDNITFVSVRFVLMTKQAMVTLQGMAEHRFNNEYI